MTTPILKLVPRTWFERLLSKPFTRNKWVRDYQAEAEERRKARAAYAAAMQKAQNARLIAKAEELRQERIAERTREACLQMDDSAWDTCGWCDTMPVFADTVPFGGDFK